MLVFFDNETKTGYASIYESHITFNKTLVSYFENAFRARIGIDDEENKVYVFLLDKDKAESGEIKESSLIPISLSKSYSRICSKALIDYIKSIFKLKIPTKEYLRYNAEYDEVKRAVVIDMKGDN